MDQELTDLLGDGDEDIASQGGTTGATAVAIPPPPPKKTGQPQETQKVPPPPAPSPVAKKKLSININKDFFKKVLEGGDREYTEKMTDQLDKAMNAPVREDRTLFRQKLIATHWNFLGSITHLINTKLSLEKKLCIRYGIADITLLTPDQIDVIRSIPLDSEYEDWPFYYMDEWLQEVASGKIKASMVDETKMPKTTTSAQQEKLDRKIDSRKASLTLFKNKVAGREAIEKTLVGSINAMITHSPIPQYDDILNVYTPEQKNIMSKFTDDFRKLKAIDNILLSHLRELRGIDSDIENIKNKMGDEGVAEYDDRLITDECNSLRQMVKMCAGPRGNHFPLLIRDYCPTSLEYVNTKENVIKLAQELEQKDAGVFYREFKGQSNRIVPYMILVPGYGEKGVCWEPFDIRQRATSRGRIAIPLYARTPKYSLLTAVGDLRWQVAKEKAGYRWMEEGLTGKYYDYFIENRLKGNIKAEFVKDYMIWILQEWNGTQKLERDVRNIFWRHMPFPQWKKDELKNRGFFYDELYKKDMNRAMSDGY